MPRGRRRNGKPIELWMDGIRSMVNKGVTQEYTETSNYFGAIFFFIERYLLCCRKLNKLLLLLLLLLGPIIIIIINFYYRMRAASKKRKEKIINPKFRDITNVEHNFV